MAATTYKKVGSVKVAGVKKIVYRKPGSAKQYVSYKGKHIGLIRYKSIKAKKILRKLKKMGGGEEMSISSILDKISSNVSNDKSQAQAQAGGKKSKKRKGKKRHGKKHAKKSMTAW